eukprot:1159227-Pelagomonas_calceolata.AAC.18
MALAHTPQSLNDLGGGDRVRFVAEMQEAFLRPPDNSVPQMSFAVPFYTHRGTTLHQQIVKKTGYPHELGYFKWEGGSEVVKTRKLNQPHQVWYTLKCVTVMLQRATVQKMGPLYEKWGDALAGTGRVEVP